MTTPSDPTSLALPPVPRAILLDLDDTLCDYTTARDTRLRIAFDMATSYLDTADRPDLDELSRESLRIAEHGDAHFGDVLKSYGVADRDAINAARAWFRTNRFHGLELFPDAVDILHWLRASCPGRRLGIVSNGPAEVQRDKIDQFGFTGLVDAILISGEVGIEKPDVRIFSTMLDLLYVAPDSAVMIGDSPELDIAGAQAAGIPAIWVNRDGRAWPSHVPSPVASIPHIGHLRKLIR